jgi:methyl-accepting chemotaxis protein
MRSSKLQMISILAPLAVLLCVGAMGYWIAGGAKAKAILFREDTLQTLTYCAELNSYQAEGYARVLLQIETDDPQRRAAYHAEAHAYREKIDEVLKNYQAMISPVEPEERAVLDNFVDKREKYRAVARQVLALANGGKLDEARKLTDASLVDAYRAYTKAGDDFFDYEVATGYQRSIDIERACLKSQILTGCICVVIFLAGLVTPFILIRLGPFGHSREMPS